MLSRAPLISAVPWHPEKSKRKRRISLKWRRAGPPPAPANSIIHIGGDFLWKSIFLRAIIIIIVASLSSCFIMSSFAYYPKNECYKSIMVIIIITTEQGDKKLFFTRITFLQVENSLFWENEENTFFSYPSLCLFQEKRGIFFYRRRILLFCVYKYFFSVEKAAKEREKVVVEWMRWRKKKMMTASSRRRHRINIFVMRIIKRTCLCSERKKMLNKKILCEMNMIILCMLYIFLCRASILGADQPTMELVQQGSAPESSQHWAEQTPLWLTTSTYSHW